MDSVGTRPIAVVNEAPKTLMVVYSEDATDNVVYRKTSLSNKADAPGLHDLGGTGWKWAAVDVAWAVAADRPSAPWPAHSSPASC